MRIWLLASVAMLSACNSEPPAATDRNSAGAAATPASAAATADARPVAPPDNATLDRLIVPRQEGRFAPRDECGSLPGARAFRAALADAVGRRDADAIAAMALQDIRLGFGGDDGKARLVERLKADGALMDQIGKILPLGCAATDGGGLTLPWFFAQDFGDIDTYRAMLVTGTDVPVLESAAAGGKVMSRIDWDVVELVSGLEPSQAFQHVRLADKRRGYIATESLRSLLDFRLLATRQDGVWKISALLAGD